MVGESTENVWHERLLGKRELVRGKIVIQKRNMFWPIIFLCFIQVYLFIVFSRVGGSFLLCIDCLSTGILQGEK